MKDTRFTTLVDNVDQLLSVVDIDDIGDVETLLMFLLARPVGVEVVWDQDRHNAALEVVIHENDEAIGSTFDFPLNVIGLARACAHTADDLGPYRVDASAVNDASDVAMRDDEQLVAALQSALGKVRLVNLMEDGGLPE